MSKDMEEGRMPEHDMPITTVPKAALARFEEAFAGRIVRPVDDGYDEARAIWNGAIDRKPGMIARCRDAVDVARAVRLAAEHDLVLSVRGGGHGVGGLALCDDGLVIDLSRMHSMEVDAGRRSVRVDPGVLLGELDSAMQPHGLAVPAGIVTHTGVAGLTLGGGIGWLMRRYGLTADNLIEADVVLADGTTVTASAEEHPDLLWGLRGGGGNFGIVSSFRFRAHPVGPTVLAGPLLFPLERAAEVVEGYRAWAVTAPREVTTILTFRLAPPAPWVPEHLRGVPVLVLTCCWCGAPEDGELPLAPLRAMGPILDAIGPRPFVELQAFFDASVPPGWHYYWKSVEVDDLTPAIVESIASRAEGLTSPRSYVIVFQLGGAIADVKEMDTAFPRREAGFDININGVWLPEEAAAAGEHVAWARATFDDIEPQARGVYVNFLGDEGTERVRDAYGRDKYEELRRTKARYDPTNMFRSNQNVTPN